MSDYIDRESTSAWLYNMGYLYAAKVIQDTKRFPSAQHEPQRTGHWISVFDEDEDKCSECQATFFCASTRFNFCPICGASMESE